MTATLNNGESCATICALLNIVGPDSTGSDYKGGFNVSLPAAGFNQTDEGLYFASSWRDEPLITYCKDVCCEDDLTQGSASGGKSSPFTYLL